MRCLRQWSKKNLCLEVFSSASVLLWYCIPVSCLHLLSFFTFPFYKHILEFTINIFFFLFFFHRHSLVTTSFNFPGVRIFKIIFFKPQHSLKGRKKIISCLSQKSACLKLSFLFEAIFLIHPLPNQLLFIVQMLSSSTVSLRFKSLRSEFASYFTCQIQSFSRSY